MTATIAQGGLGFTDRLAGSIIGVYGFGVYATAIVGGWLADRVFGQYRSVLLGGIIIALGHFSMAIPTVVTFFLGLCLIMTGTGLLKPNASTMVGALYDETDARRDAGFSIFYVGINVGAFAAPLIVGTLGQEVNWHLGFACAGVGMIIGLIQYVAGKPRLVPALQRLGQTETHAAPVTEPWWRFTRAEWGRVAAIAVLFVFSAVFWGAFEQASSSLNLFADRLTRNRLFGFDFPSTWYQSLNSMYMIFGLAPLIGWVWVRMGDRQPSSPVKFALGLLFVGLGFALIIPAARVAQAGVKVSPWWLIGLYFLHTIGELCLSPVGLSIVTKLAPQRIAGAMMGVWFVSIAVGNMLAGLAGGMFQTLPLPSLFGAVAGVAFVAALILLAITPWLRQLMGGVR
jgi:POT family proton-dependent oligopeptide transporter